MNRILHALGAFALSLVLVLGLAASPLCAAAEAPVDAAVSAGYLVILNPQVQLLDASADLLGQATLLAADSERAELLPLAEDIGIYKANDLSDIQNLVWSGQVQLAEPDYQAELLELDLADPAHPNDDYFVSNYQFNLTHINAQAAWDAGLTGEGVTVAVIDSGLNISHLDVPVKVGRGRYYFYREEEGGRYDFTIDGVTRYYNYYSNDNIVDDRGHGTMCAGIIAANTNNADETYTGGIAGLAPNVTIMPIRCFTSTPGYLGGYTSNLISGITFAVENGADIINMSWGVRGESASLLTAITRAANAGCILIAAAGNDGTNSIQYPAAYDSVISVGSTNKQGGLSDFSQRNAFVNVCAPGGTHSGQQIHSLWHTSPTAIGNGDGTSFSAPIIAGVAALMKEHDPTMTQADFLALLEATSSLDGIALADQPYAGCGLVDLSKLLDATGHTGTMFRYNSDGGLTVRAAHHPQTGQATPENVLILIGAYNAAGHLLDSSIALSSLTASGFGSYSHYATFQAPDTAILRAFFLDSATLVSVAEPVELALER